LFIKNIFRKAYIDKLYLYVILFDWKVSNITRLNDNLAVKQVRLKAIYSIGGIGWYRFAYIEMAAAFLINIEQVYNSNGGSSAFYIYLPSVGCVKIASAKQGTPGTTKFRTVSAGNGGMYIDFNYEITAANSVMVSVLPITRTNVNNTVYSTASAITGQTGTEYVI
jgi:hypothetical protein